MITDVTKTGVSILTSTDGENHRKAYVNSLSGRAELIAEQDEETVAEIMTLWGDSPTIEEPEVPNPQPAAPTTEDRLAALEAVQLTLILGGGV